MASVGSEIPSEIERVSALRERYRHYAKEEAFGQATFGPAILMMTQALDAATAANAGGDVIEIIRAYEDLRGFSE